MSKMLDKEGTGRYLLQVAPAAMAPKLTTTNVQDIFINNVRRASDLTHIINKKLFTKPLGRFRFGVWRVDR